MVVNGHSEAQQVNLPTRCLTMGVQGFQKQQGVSSAPVYSEVIDVHAAFMSVNIFLGACSLNTVMCICADMCIFVNGSLRLHTM